MSSLPPHQHQAYIPTRPDGRPERPVLATVIAIVDIVGGLGSLVLGALMVIAAATTTDGDEAGLAVFAGILLVMGLLSLLSGIGLLMVASWGRTLQIVTSILGLACIGPGTIVNALILAYVFQRKVALIYSGRRVSELSEPERHLLVAPGAGGGGAAGIVIAIVAIGFVMIAVVGIIAAIAVPNLLNAVQRGKQKRTMADIRTIATALEARATDFNAYPPAASVDELIPVLVPTYATSLPVMDAWNHPFAVATTDRTYVLRSAGKDGVFELEDPELYPRGGTTAFASDIVFANGEFVQHPEGTQQ